MFEENFYKAILKAIESHGRNVSVRGLSKKYGLNGIEAGILGVAIHFERTGYPARPGRERTKTGNISLHKRLFYFD